LELEFFDDAGAFLDAAGAHLAQEPVVSTVVAVVADRMRRQRAAGIARPAGAPCWFVVARDGRDVSGAAMRTATSPPHAPYLLPMPAEAARLLARTLFERGELALDVHGALPAVAEFLDETAALAGKTVRRRRTARLFELGDLVEARAVPGRMRTATRDDLPRVMAWFEAFFADAEEQSGRAPGASPPEPPSVDDVGFRIDSGRVFLWEDASGVPVHLTAASQAAFGVSRIAPVYTPREQRGRGYASAGVSHVSRLLRDAGERVCLFTDLANPTSNKIYEAIGYRPVVDMANLYAT
jgi:GNAT superfamily N-acetyltransferase